MKNKKYILRKILTLKLNLIKIKLLIYILNLIINIQNKKLILKRK